MRRTGYSQSCNTCGDRGYIVVRMQPIAKYRVCPSCSDAASPEGQDTRIRGVPMPADRGGDRIAQPPTHARQR